MPCSPSARWPPPANGAGRHPGRDVALRRLDGRQRAVGRLRAGPRRGSSSVAEAGTSVVAPAPARRARTPCPQRRRPLLHARPTTDRRRVLGPTANGGFYVASLVAGFCSIIPAHFGTALVRRGHRRSWRLALRAADGPRRVDGRCRARHRRRSRAGTLGARVVRRGNESSATALAWLTAMALPFAVRASTGWCAGSTANCGVAP